MPRCGTACSWPSRPPSAWLSSWAGGRGWPWPPRCPGPWASGGWGRDSACCPRVSPRWRPARPALYCCTPSWVCSPGPSPEAANASRSPAVGGRGWPSGPVSRSCSCRSCTRSARCSRPTPRSCPTATRDGPGSWPYPIRWASPRPWASSRWRWGWRYCRPGRAAWPHRSARWPRRSTGSASSTWAGSPPEGPRTRPRARRSSCWRWPCGRRVGPPQRLCSSLRSR